MRDHLETQLRFNQYIADRNLGDVTQEESLVRALPDGASMHGLIRHLLETRGRVLPQLGEAAPVLDEAMSIGELHRLFTESTETVSRALARATGDALAAPSAFRRGGGAETLGSMLIKVFAHESYHLGQIGLLRRIAGKEGALK